MPDVSVVYGEHGAPLAPVECRGKLYRPGLLVQGRKARFVRWLKQRELEQLALVRETLGAAEYEARKERLFARFDAGEFGFYGPVAQGVIFQGAPGPDGKPAGLADPDGLVAFVAAVFDCTEDDAVQLMAARGAEVGQALAHVLAESMPNVKPAEGADPNGKAPPA